jgi:hypothetical protein
MQKLSKTSSGKNRKSCSTLHQESKKIGFAFFIILYNCLRILQVSAKHKHYLRIRFVRTSLKVLIPYGYALGLRLGPRKELKPCNVVPRGGGWRGRRNSGEAGGLVREGAGAGWSWGSLGSISTGGWGGGGAGGVARRRRPLPAAGCPALASFRPGHANGRRGQLQQGLGVVLGWLHGRGS